MTQDEIMTMWKESGGFYIIGIPYDILKAFAKLVEARASAKEREEFNILFAEHQKLLGELQAMRLAKDEEDFC